MSQWMRITIKIVTTQLSDWHILFGLSQFAHHWLVLKNCMFVDYSIHSYFSFFFKLYLKEIQVIKSGIK